MNNQLQSPLSLLGCLLDSDLGGLEGPPYSTPAPVKTSHGSPNFEVCQI